MQATNTASEASATIIIRRTTPNPPNAPPRRLPSPSASSTSARGVAGATSFESWPCTRASAATSGSASAARADSTVATAAGVTGRPEASAWRTMARHSARSWSWIPEGEGGMGTRSGAGEWDGGMGPDPESLSNVDGGVNPCAAKRPERNAAFAWWRVSADRAASSRGAIYVNGGSKGALSGRPPARGGAPPW